MLKIKPWEHQSLRGLVEHLGRCMPLVSGLMFYYSFQIPKLGKEFDLLRCSDELIVNIELKSISVPEEKISKQLLQNRYYLSTLGRNLRCYTYIHDCERLVRLTNSGKLVDAKWQELAQDLASQINCYEGHAEALFKEEDYIISPLASPDKFLNREYFLTAQQRDIEKHILYHAKKNGASFQGITGAPGTGKTLLLYDIAMYLSEQKKVAVFHCSTFPRQLAQLDARLKRIDFFRGADDGNLPELGDYHAICVDEAHYANHEVLNEIVSYAKKRGIPVVFSYDCEDSIFEEELDSYAVKFIESCEAFERHRLTNKIRMNAELSTFIHALMRGGRGNHLRDYPNVSLYYANDITEANQFSQWLNQQEYTLIYDKEEAGALALERKVPISRAISAEYQKVVMVMDEDFYYSDCGLRCHTPIDTAQSAGNPGEGTHRVRNLFHGLSRGKSKLVLLVINNPSVFENMLTIVQGKVSPLV